MIRQRNARLLKIEDERFARGTTSVHRGIRAAASFWVSSNTLRYNGQTRRALGDPSPRVRRSGAMFPCVRPVPFQHTGTLCEAENRILSPSSRLTVQNYCYHSRKPADRQGSFLKNYGLAVISDIGCVSPPKILRARRRCGRPRPPPSGRAPPPAGYPGSPR